MFSEILRGTVDRPVWKLKRREGGLTYSLPALFVAYSISSNLPDSTFKTNQTTTQEADTFWVALSTFGV